MPRLTLELFHPDTQPPAGLIVDDALSSRLWPRLNRYPDLMLARLPGRLAVFATGTPDLPWIEGATYLRALGQGVLCPVGYRVNAPAGIWPALAAQLRHYIGAEGMMLIEPGEPLGVCDLQHAQRCDRLDLTLGAPA